MRGILRFGALGALCAGAACGSVTVTPDAAVTPDTPPDTPAPAVTHRWIVDKQILPRTNPEATMLGLDLDNNGAVDNQFGAVLAALSSQGFDSQAAADAAISRGTILTLAEASVGPTAGTFTTYTGTNPQPTPCNGPNDPVCRRHLQGTGTFGVVASSANPPLPGTISNGTLVAGPGHLQIALMFSFGGTTPLFLDLIGARARLPMIAAGALGQGVIAGAVPQSQIDTRVYPAIHQAASAAVAADCTSTTMPPDCGCAAGSQGRTFLNLFDTSPKDCTITLDEIRNNSLIKSLLAPDVTVEGQMSLSVGFGVTAVKATFTP